MKIAKFFLKLKKGSVCQLVTQLEDVFLIAYLEVLWTSPVNLTVSFDLPFDLLKEFYSSKEPILIKLNDELYLQARLVAIVKNNLMLSLSSLLTTPDYLKWEHFKLFPDVQNPLVGGICIDGICASGYLKSVNDSSVSLALHSEKLEEFSQRIVLSGAKFKDLLNKHVEFNVKLPNGLSYEGKGKIKLIKLYKSSELTLEIGNIIPDKGLDEFKNYIIQRRKDVIQALMSL